MRTSAFIILAIFLCLITVKADSTTPKYVVAFPDNKFYPQYELIDGQLRGLLPDLLRKLAEESKIQMELRVYPIKRYTQLFDQGEVDFVLPDNPLWLSKEQANRVRYSRVIMASPVAFYEKTKKPLKDPSQLRSVGTISGYVVTPMEGEIEAGRVKVLYAKKIKALLQMLLRERTQLIFFHKQIMDQILREQRDLSSHIALNSKLSTVNYNYHLSTIRHEAILAKFDDWLKANVDWLEERSKFYQMELFGLR